MCHFSHFLTFQIDLVEPAPEVQFDEPNSDEEVQQLQQPKASKKNKKKKRRAAAKAASSAPVVAELVSKHPS